MAIRRVIGFETGSIADELLEVVTSGATISTSVVRTGYASLYANPATGVNQNVRVRDLDTAGALQNFALNSVWVRCYVRVETLPTATPRALLVFWTGAAATTAIGQVRITSSGQLEFRDVPNDSIVGTTSTALALDTWYCVEAKFTNNSVQGDWEVSLDGVQEISASPSSWSAGQVTGIGIGVVNSSSEACAIYFDDLVVDDDTRPGAGAIYRLDPNASGNYADFGAGTGGGSYGEVDDYPAAGNDGDTSYVVSSTYLHRFSVQCESCDDAGVPAGAEIKAVAALVVCRDEATTLAWKSGIRSNTTDSLKTSADGPSAYSGAASTRQALFLVDPATSAAWTRSAVDAAEPLIQHDQNAVRALRVTAMCLMVAVSEPSGVTGTGAVVAGAATVDGAGVSGSTGEGAAAAGAAAVAAAGVSGSTGAGAPAADPATVDASGVSGAAGAGAVAAGAAAAAGAGASGSTGSGAAAAGPATASGSNAVVTVTPARKWFVRLASPKPMRLRLVSPKPMHVRLVSPKPYYIRQSPPDA